MTPNLNQEVEPFYQTESDPKKFIEFYLQKYKSLYYSRKVKEIEKLLSAYCQDLQKKTVLDIGCCGGFFSVKFAKQGAAVMGIDISKNAVAAAVYHAKQENVTCAFLCGDLSVLPPKKTFDVILAKDVIEHIVDDASFMKQLSGLLNPGGFLIITTQNWFCFNYFFEGALRKMLYPAKKWVGWDPTHVRWYSAWSLQEKMKEAGLSPLQFSGSYYVPYEILKALKIEARSRCWVVIDDLLGGRWPLNRLGWSISVVGKK